MHSRSLSPGPYHWWRRSASQTRFAQAAGFDGARFTGGLMSRDSVRLKGDASAPSRARRFVASCCEELPTEARDVVLLLTSELVTNAVVHGEGDVLLEIHVDSGIVSVAVRDQGDGVVRPASRFSWPETGHGLTLVRKLSDRWGVEQTSGTSGKRVWFELERGGDDG